MNKAALRRMALEVRAELGLTAYEVFDPLALADLYGVDVIRLSDLACSPETLAHFQEARPNVFSGALVPLSDGGTVIVENDAHNAERRVSTASHEMAHVVLEHPFSASLTDGNGCRVSSQSHEHEAVELGGELLLPADAALRLARSDRSDAEAAEEYKVSVDLARWRMNATGARKIVARARAKRANRT